ncbi:MAG: PIN domain-containing protein [Oscillospiraceae bacterium]|nr:PIN domain-containing protein [Oscillospiraceae bacterium]
MKKLKIYLDTSIIGYLYQETQPEKMAETRQLWGQIKSGAYEAIISNLLLEELSNNPNEEIRNILLEFLAEIDYEIVPLSSEIEKLAVMIISHGVLTQKSYEDCLHIATALVHDCNLLVSWNFKHLVNIRTINGVRAISNLEGYKTIDIVTPTLLIQEGDD